MAIKRLVVCAVSAISLLSWLCCALAQESLGWQPTLDAARKAASQSNRLVLIYFQADWCKACRAMERDTLSQPGVLQNLQANYAPVKVNADFLPMTAKQYGVTLLPTTVVTTADGQLVDKMVGAVDPQQFVGRLNQVAVVARRQNNSVLAQVPAGPAAGYPGQVAPPPGLAPPVMSNNAAMPGAAASQNTAMLGGPMSSAPAPVGAMAPQGGVRSPANDRYADFNRTYGDPAVGATVDPRVAPLGSNPMGPMAGVGSVAPSAGPMAGTMPNLQAGPGQLAAPTMSGGPMPGMAGVPTGIAPVASPVAATQPVDTVNPPLGLDGFCPVALSEKQTWVRGDRRWGLVHRGRTYLFSGQAERDRFNADPDAYAPVMSGVDIVVAFDRGEQVAGRRECGVFYQKRVYLFTDEASLKKFEQNKVFYATQVLQAMRSTANGGNMYR